MQRNAAGGLGVSPNSLSSSPKIGGHRGLKAETSQIRLDPRQLTHRWQKAIEDVLVRVREQEKPVTDS